MAYSEDEIAEKSEVKIRNKESWSITFTTASFSWFEEKLKMLIFFV